MDTYLAQKTGNRKIINNYLPNWRLVSNDIQQFQSLSSAFINAFINGLCEKVEGMHKFEDDRNLNGIPNALKSEVEPKQS